MQSSANKKRKSEDDQIGEGSSSSASSSSNDPQHIRDREELETVRIDALYKIDEEKKRNEQKRKEIEILEKLKGRQLSYQQVLATSNDSSSNKVKEILQSGENIVKLMVGGKMFVTSLSTINKRDNMIKTMLNSDFKVDRDENGCILLSESNPDYFPIILEHIRTGSTNYVGLWEQASEENIHKLKSLLLESDFFGTSKLSAAIAKLIKEFNINQKLNKDSMVDEDEESQTPVKTSKQTTLFNNQGENDEKWLEMFRQLTLKEKTVMEKFLKQSQDELEKEREELRQREASLKVEPIIFNVRGVNFVIGIEKLLVHQDSIFPQLILNSSNNEIFLDRDSEVFSILFEYLENGTFNSIPKDLTRKKLVYKEAKEFKLNQVLEFLDPLRYPIEDIGTENIKIKKDEDFLRNLFVGDRENQILSDPYLHLISVFGNEQCTRDLLDSSEPPSSLPLIFDFENPVESTELINEYSNLKLPPKPRLVSSREEFFSQFNALTCGIFKNMDWTNIFSAGGGILACLLRAELDREDLLTQPNRYSRFRKQPDFSAPVIDTPKRRVLWEQDDCSGDEDEQKVEDGYFSATSSEEEKAWKPQKKKATSQKGSMRDEPSLDEDLFNYYRNSYWKNSDIDLFIYGLTEKEAEAKITYLYDLFKQNLKNIPKYARDETGFEDILLIRTENAITFKFINSIRSVQVILRIYKSPAEVLIGFDVNCCCVGFDGFQVYALPRAIQAIKTRCNIVDVARQSTTYELRLVKYALRGFRIGIAGFDEKKIQNDVLIQNQFYKPQRWRKFYNFRQSPKLGNVTGLAKILLIRHTYKHSKFRGGLKAIGGGENLDSAERMVSKSKYHDYVQINFRFTWNRTSNFLTAQEYFNHISARTKYLTEDAKKKLFFEFSLNDLDGVIVPKNPKSDLPPHLEWITYEPTRQYVCGSFHPHNRNFFKDAYTDLKTESKASGMKKYCTYQWIISGRRHKKVLNDKESKLIEEAYRQFRAQKKNKALSKYILPDGKTVNFKSMEVSMEDSKGYWRYNRLTATRVRDSFIFVKKSKDELTDIHEVLQDEEENDSNSEEETYKKKKTPTKKIADYSSSEEDKKPTKKLSMKSAPSKAPVKKDSKYALPAKKISLDESSSSDEEVEIKASKSVPSKSKAPAKQATKNDYSSEEKLVKEKKSVPSKAASSKSPAKKKKESSSDDEPITKKAPKKK